jgi:hypothetical protein
MDDEEYQEYLKIRKDHDSLSDFKAKAMTRAMKILEDHDFTVKKTRYENAEATPMECHYEKGLNGVCDACIPYWILGECPYSRSVKMSK